MNTYIIFEAAGFFWQALTPHPLKSEMVSPK